MENASKALIIAGGILIALLVISSGVYIFSIYSNFTLDVEKQKQMHAIMEFNARFEKYNRENVTAHEIVTIANLAKENNEKYELANATSSEDSYYIQVSVNKLDGGTTNYNNFEKHRTISIEDNKYQKEYLNEKNDFLSKYSINSSNKIQYFKCVEVLKSTITKRVYKIVFEPQ